MSFRTTNPLPPHEPLQTHRAFLLLGGNMGNREKLLAMAKAAISAEVGTIEQASLVYETAAWGIEQQPDFLNQVVLVSTVLGPEQLLSCILGIETKLGRVRNEKWHSRIMDIDILYYDNCQIDLPHLKIPHPQIQYRNFTLRPLAEIAPDLVHPLLGKSNQTLLLECKDPLAAGVFDHQ